MVEFLNKDKAWAAMVEIVSKADSKLVLISPYIRIPDDLLQRLKYKDKQGIKTIVVCREKDLDSEVRSDLKQLRHLELLFDDDLHGKCFYNEKSMVITSLNLLESSARKNREMGVLFSSEEDSSVFNEALKEAEYIIDGAKKDSTPSRTKQKGYCINCGKSKTYDLDAPYCPDCYRVWNKFKDPDYKEEFCHLCGTPNQPTTMHKPLCNSCYNKSLRK